MSKSFLTLQSGETVEVIPSPLGAESTMSDAHPPPLSQFADGRDPYWDMVKRRNEALSRQTVLLAVAPGCSFRSPRTGRLLTEGAELTTAEFTGGQLRELITRGVALESTPEQVRAAMTPSNVRYRVCQTILLKGGMFLVPGDEALPAHFDGGIDRIRELLALGVITENPAGDE